MNVGMVEPPASARGLLALQPKTAPLNINPQALGKKFIFVGFLS
jgi:hypothetical protein